MVKPIKKDYFDLERIRVHEPAMRGEPNSLGVSYNSELMREFGSLPWFLYGTPLAVRNQISDSSSALPMFQRLSAKKACSTKAMYFR